MALADRRSDRERHKITGAASASISSSFAEGKHVELQVFPGEAALLYQIQQLEEDIDELRRYVTNEATGSAINLTLLDGDTLPTVDPRVSGKLWVDTRNGNVIKVS
tara:strand:+ start:252 stop:569 length:318 start_codon:yes stop_codon:yes gene_type:complete